MCDFPVTDFLCDFFVRFLSGRVKHENFIRSDEGLRLESSAFQLFHGGYSLLISYYDTIKFSDLHILNKMIIIPQIGKDTSERLIRIF